MFRDADSKVYGKVMNIGFPSFVERHIGPDAGSCARCCNTSGTTHWSPDDAAVPDGIRFREKLDLPEPETEFEVLRKFREIALKNRVANYIGLGYHACVTPPVIQRNILENPVCTRPIRLTKRRSPRVGSRHC